MPRAHYEDPKVTIRNLLIDQWNHPAVDDHAAGNEGFEWVIDSHFEPSKWTHTGWYNDQSPNPELTVSTRRETTDSPTGWTGIDGSGRGPVAQVDGQLRVDAWAGDEGHMAGINPKQYSFQLATRALIILGQFAQSGVGDMQFLGIDTVDEVEEPSDSDLPPGGHHQLRVVYSWHRTTG